MHTAQVIASHSRDVILETTEGELLKASSRGNVPALIAGDQVQWSMVGEDQAVVETLIPRENLLAKQNRYGKQKLVASNIDMALIVIAPEPQPYFELIDRYWIALENAGIQTALLGNKMDVVETKYRQDYENMLTLYARLGMPTFQISAKAPASLTDLSQAIHAKKAILLGQSGVGKSSITRQLAGVDIRTQDLSIASRLGQHTTTATTAYPLLSGQGYLIDSPGVRGFSPQITSLAELEQGFPEISSVSGNCQFRDCSHQHEPNCAVLAALKAGEIHRIRLQNFLHIRDKMQLK